MLGMGKLIKGTVGVCAAALLFAGCGSSAPSSATRTISLSRAAYVSSGSSGYRVVMSLRESVPNVGQVLIGGMGSFSIPSHSGTMTLRMSLPAAAAGLSNLTIPMVIAHGTIYMRFPPQLADRIPGGKPWWEINLAQAGNAAGVPGLSSLTGGTSSLNDPGQYLDFLRATSSGSLKNLGQATVNGVQTTHYSAQIELSKLPEAVPASARAGIAQLVAALQKRGTVSQIPIDAWIDSSNLVRQIELVYDQPISSTGQTAAVSLKMDFIAYGPQPRPAIPPPGQTVNLLALLHRQA
jgi:hypothetical protein